jgi:transcriptional regulator with XRE-family HTH domain
VGQKLGTFINKENHDDLIVLKELIESGGLNHSTIVNIERNHQEPHFRTIRKVAKALDIDPTELLGD